nr:EamA family transporter [uncultured Agathobaculum sp.]
MDKQQILYTAILLAGIFVCSVSQVLLKKASMKTYASPLKEYLNPQVIFAYMLFFGTTVMTVTAYKVIPLSLGAVLETTSYLYITFFSVVIFKEKLNGKKILSLLLIIAGSIICTVLG